MDSAAAAQERNEQKRVKELGHHMLRCCVGRGTNCERLRRLLLLIQQERHTCLQVPFIRPT
jgi:hypothetical protein